MAAPRDDDQAPRDAHLLAALRHAPDRDIAPPPEVTARILSAARVAARAPAAPTALQRLATWWHRPRLAAAFGTLVAALLVGLLWSTREPLPSVRETIATAPQDAATGRAADAPAPAEAPPAESAQRPPASPPNAKTNRPVPPPPARDAQRQREQRGATPAEGDRARDGPVVSAPATAPPTADAASTAGAETGRLLGRSEAPDAAVQARVGQQAAGASTDPLQSLDALLLGAPDAARVTWRGSRTFEHGPAQRAWWREWRAATQGRWLPAEAAPQPFEPWLTLSVDGRERARWWLQGDDGLLLTDAQGRNWRARIEPAQARAWREAVAGW